MPLTSYGPGDLCYCEVDVCNPTDIPESELPIFVILDVFGSLFFAPDFSDFNYYNPVLIPGFTTLHVLPEFTWPAGTGEAEGILWYAGITGADMQYLIGDVDIFSFGWHE